MVNSIFLKYNRNVFYFNRTICKSFYFNENLMKFNNVLALVILHLIAF